jgi:hypothetical protein
MRFLLFLTFSVYTLTKTVEIRPDVVINITPQTTPKEMREMIENKLKGVTVVNDRESAKRVLEIIQKHKNRYAFQQ